MIAIGSQAFDDLCVRQRVLYAFMIQGKRTNDMISFSYRNIKSMKLYTCKEEYNKDIIELEQHGFIMRAAVDTYRVSDMWKQWKGNI